MTAKEPNHDQTPDAPPESKPKTLWHRLLGTWLELLLTWVDVGVITEPFVMSEPPKADILLLRRLDLSSPRRHSRLWTPAQRRFLPDGVRDSPASHHLIEFKFTESLNSEALEQALGYNYFYRQSQKLKKRDLQTYIFSARTPQPGFLQEFGYAVAEHPGIYRSSNPILQPIILLLLNNLRPELHNAFVQCFASRGRVRRAAFTRLETIDWKELSEALWDFYVGLQRHLGEKEREEMLMATQEILTPEMIMETGKRLRKSLLAVLTPEERLAGLAPEERLAGLKPEERLAGLAPEERLAGLKPEERLTGMAPEERLAGLKPEELIALMAQIEAYLRQQPSKQENDLHE